MWHTTPATEIIIARSMDVLGDSYTEELTLAKFEEIRKVQQSGSSAVVPPVASRVSNSHVAAITDGPPSLLPYPSVPVSRLTAGGGGGGGA